MSSNKEMAAFLTWFSEREEGLFARAKAVGVDLDQPCYRSWQMWYGDPLTYIDALESEIEQKETHPLRGPTTGRPGYLHDGPPNNLPE